MPSSFLARRGRFRLPNGLLILLVVFFFVPFAFRGARLSLEKTENNVKDWLPSSFVETRELQWYGKYFSGERYIIATWEGCVEGDERLEMFAAKLREESAQGREKLFATIPDYARAQKVAQEYQLLLPSNLHRNWGGENEIWLRGGKGEWFYLLPDGRFYRWSGRDDSVGGLIRVVQRLVRGPFVQGQLIGAFGSPGSGGAASANPDRINIYYNRPFLLTMPLINKVQSGPELVAELSRKGGPFDRPIAAKPEFKRLMARRDATECLTGYLFAPSIPANFDWRGDALLDLFPAKARAKLPADLSVSLDEALAEIVADRFDGDLQKLKKAPAGLQMEVLYELFDAQGLSPPSPPTALIVTLTPAANEHLQYVAGRGVLGGPLGRVYELAAESGLAPPPRPVMVPPPFNRWVGPPPSLGPDLHVGGPPIDNVAIDEEGTVTLVRLVGYCAALGLLLSYWCFRSLKLMVMIFFVGVVSAAASLSFVWWSGAGVDAILMSMPSLVYVLGLSSAIHIVNYYREEVQTAGEEGAAERALAHGWGPCTLASLTTAIGLVSLYSSNIIPIQKFGLYAAIGVLATLVILFAYLPASLQIFVPRFRREPAPRGEATGASSAAHYWELIGRWVVGHYRLVTAACAVLFLGAALGLPKVQTSVQLLKLFSADSRIIQDYAWLEERYGKLVPMEVILRVPPEMQAEKLQATQRVLATSGRGVAAEVDPHALSILDRLRATEHIQRTIEATFGEQGSQVVGRAMSVRSFTPELPSPRRGLSAFGGGFYESVLAGEESLLQEDYLRIERFGPLIGSELWRISVRVAALGDVNYGHFVDDLKLAVNPILEAYRLRQSIREMLHTAARKPRLLIVGRPQPKPIGEEPFLDAGAVDQRAIYATILDELLAGEFIARPYWLDPFNAKGIADTNNQNFLRKVTEEFDLVILLEDAPKVDPVLLQQASVRFLDGRRNQFSAGPTEIVDGVPLTPQSGPLQVIYSGVIPVVYKAQNALLSSLVESIGWAFVLIALVMAVVLNPGLPLRGMLRPDAIMFGIGAGLVAMIPNVFPLVVVFGMMGHLGTLVDIGTMMTASVAMGVAVDDTIHFLSWLRRGLDSGLDRYGATIQAYRRCGPAMMQTTIVGGLGLFVFALSTFTPTQKFGTLMLVLLAAALVGDLVFLPALLSGPLGRLFRARPQAAGRADIEPAARLDDEHPPEIPQPKLQRADRQPLRSDLPHRQNNRR